MGIIYWLWVWMNIFINFCHWFLIANSHCFGRIDELRWTLKIMEVTRTQTRERFTSRIRRSRRSRVSYFMLRKEDCFERLSRSSDIAIRKSSLLSIIWIATKYFRLPATKISTLKRYQALFWETASKEPIWIRTASLNTPILNRSKRISPRFRR